MYTDRCRAARRSALCSRHGLSYRRALAQRRERSRDLIVLLLPVGGPVMQ